MFPSVSVKERVGRSRDPDLDLLKRIYNKTRQSHRTLRVPANSKLAFYDNYRNIKRVKERLKQDSAREPASVALLRSLDNQKLRPLALGLTNPDETQINVSTGLTDRYASAFSKGLKRLKRLETLTLRGSRLAQSSSSKILRSLHVKSMKVLDLSGNQIGSSGITKVMQMLSTGTLQVLNLEASNIAETNVVELCQCLETNHSLKSLNLAKNKLSRRAGLALARLLTVNTALNMLDLHWNLLFQEGAAHLFEALKGNTTLLQLDLSWNGLGTVADSLVHPLSDCIKANETLRHLDLGYNSFDWPDCSILATALQQNHTLIGLHMLGNAAEVDRMGFLQELASPGFVKSPFAHRRVLANQQRRVGENCWICDRWVETRIEFPNPAQSVSPLFVHLEVDNFVPIPMKIKPGVYVYTRMLPPTQTRIFFSDLNGNLPLPESATVVDASYQLSAEYYPGHTKSLQVTKASEVTPAGLVYTAENGHKCKPRRPIPQYKPPTQAASRPAWDLASSIFREYIFDTPELLNRCFEFDWKHTKAERLIKDETELAECKAFLKQDYARLKNLYKSLSLMSFGEYFSVSSNTVFEMLSQSAVLNSFYGPSDFGVNWNGAVLPKIKGQFYNPGNALVRYEFLELLVRVAYDKFYRSKLVSTPYQAIVTFVGEIEDALQAPAFQEFKKLFYCEEVELFFLEHARLIEQAYVAYSGRKTLPGKKRFMSLEEFRELSAELVGLNEVSTAREVDQAFCFAMMTQVDELFTKRHMEMNRLEFYEALGRLSYFAIKNESFSLGRKLEALVPNLLSLSRLTRFKRQNTLT